MTGVFTPLPRVPDHPELEREGLARWEERAHLRAAARAEPRRPALQLHRRADHGEQPDGRAPRLGPHATRTSTSATRRCAATTSATRTASTARACGSRWRWRRSSGSTRSATSRQYGLAEFAARCRERVAEYSEVQTDAVAAAGPVDGLGQLLLHHLRHEHRVHLAFPRRLPTSEAGSTGAIDRCRGARAAARRSRSTSWWRGQL